MEKETSEEPRRKWDRYSAEFRQQALERMKTCDNVKALAKELGVLPLAEAYRLPPLRGGDFQGIGVYRSDVFLGKSAKANFRVARLNTIGLKGLKLHSFSKREPSPGFIRFHCS